MTLAELCSNADGVYDFVNVNGESVDDMQYPLTTEVLSIRHIELDQYEITLPN